AGRLVCVVTGGPSVGREAHPDREVEAADDQGIAEPVGQVDLSPCRPGNPERRQRGRERQRAARAGHAGTRAWRGEGRARQKSGRSAGVRLETRCPSTTTLLSTNVAPAFSRSSRIAETPVTVRPFRMRALIGTQPAWQIMAMGLPAWSNSRTRSRTAGSRLSFSGPHPPGTKT